MTREKGNVCVYVHVCVRGREDEDVEGNGVGRRGCTRSVIDGVRNTVL